MASKVDARLLKSTKFPPEFNQKVDMGKVNLHVMKKWIANKIPQILGNEDDVLTELVYNLIEGSQYPDIKSLQIQLTGFLDKDTPSFCKELWNLLLSGQNSPQGVPKELLEAKKLELMQEKMDADRANARRGHEVQDLKERERRDRRQAADSWQGRGRRGDRAFGSRGRGGYGRVEQRPPSPGPRRRDTYVPESRRGCDEISRRGRGRGSPSEREPSRSRSRSPTSGSSPRSPTPPRRRDSPPRRPSPQKRYRSPYSYYRPRRRGNDSRDRLSPHGRSRSRSSDHFSPAPKRRRHSRPRSSSVERRRRHSSSLYRSKSRWDYRHLSPHRDSTPRRRGRESPVKRRHERHEGSDSDNSEREHARGRGRGKGARGRDGGSPRGRDDSTGRRRNGSSASSPSPTRGKSADVLEDELRAASPKAIASIEKTDEKRRTFRSENLLKEKLLREKIMKMRTSNQGGASTGGRG